LSLGSSYLCTDHSGRVASVRPGVVFGAVVQRDPSVTGEFPLRRTGADQAVLVVEVADQVGDGLGIAVVVALGQRETEFGEHRGLIFGLHTLGDHLQVQRFTQGGNDSQQRRGRGIGSNGCYEALIYLQNVAGDGGQAAQRGVSGAEIVDGDAYTAITQRVEIV